MKSGLGNSIAVLVALIMITFNTTLPAQGQATETVLHAFSGAPEGVTPISGVAFDDAGNLLGTTSEGGNTLCTKHGCGVVFELSSGSGGWTYSNVYTFLGGQDGGAPNGAPAIDGAGNVYVASKGYGKYMQGTIGEFKPNGHGGWAPTLVHTFQGPEGAYPGGVTVDSAGDIYGMTQLGGKSAHGTVYKISPKAGGGFKTQVLHSFTNGADGGDPQQNTVTLDASGHIFGMTQNGGNVGCNFGCGVVFALSQNSSGEWFETVLYSFAGGTDGYASGNVVVDSSDNVYGSSQGGGIVGGNCGGSGCGYVFKLSRGASGKWTKDVLYQFTAAADGSRPENIAIDSTGNLYIVTATALNELSPGSGGAWRNTVLHSFTTPAQGIEPVGIPVVDGSGNVYGDSEQGGDLSCSFGGSAGCGLVYEITP